MNIMFYQKLPAVRGGGCEIFVSVYDWGVSDIPHCRHPSLTASVDFRHRPGSC